MEPNLMKLLVLASFLLLQQNAWGNEFKEKASFSLEFQKLQSNIKRLVPIGPVAQLRGIVQKIVKLLKRAHTAGYIQSIIKVGGKCLPYKCLSPNSFTKQQLLCGLHHCITAQLVSTCQTVWWILMKNSWLWFPSSSLSRCLRTVTRARAKWKHGREAMYLQQAARETQRDSVMKPLWEGQQVGWKATLKTLIPKVSS